MHHKDEIDDIIIGSIQKGQYGFYKLAKKYNRRTLSIHLEKLENQGMIKRYPPREPGGRGSCELTPFGKSLLEYEIWEGIPSNRKKKDSITVKKCELAAQNRCILSLLLDTAVSGAHYMIPTANPLPGDMAVKNTTTGEWEALSLEIKKGVSVQDLIECKLTDPRLWSEFSEKQVRNLIEKLSNDDHPVLDRINLDKEEVRYSIADPILRDLLLECKMIIDLIRYRMEYTWTYVRKAKKSQIKGRPSPEVTWYNDVFGNGYTGKFFSTLDERRRYQFDIDKECYYGLLKDRRARMMKNKQPNQDDILSIQKEALETYHLLFSTEVKKNYIKSLDMIIKTNLANLEKNLKKKYDQLTTKYPFLQIIVEKVNPEYLSDYHKRNII